MARPPLVFFAGDFHSGSDTSLAPPNFYVKSKDRVYPLSRSQEWLLECWKETLKAVGAASIGRPLVFCYGGDGVDGVQHHGSTQTFGNRHEQREMLFELLRPIVNISDAIYALKGTSAHVGEEGSEDQTVAEMMGARIDYDWRLRINGRILEWAHHGVTVSKRPHLEEAAIIRQGVDIDTECALERIEKPSLVMWHDRHVSPALVKLRDMWLCVCPCWQLPTEYVKSFAPRSKPSIGFCLWDTQTNDLKRIVYSYDRPITNVEVEYRGTPQADAPGPAGTGPAVHPTPAEDAH